MYVCDFLQDMSDAIQRSLIAVEFYYIVSKEDYIFSKGYKQAYL